MTLLPFNSVAECPKCGLSTSGCSVRYSQLEEIDCGNGNFIDVHNVGHALRPHLRKNCPHCHYGWLEQCKDAVICVWCLGEHNADDCLIEGVHQ